MPTRLYVTFAIAIVLAVGLFYYHKLGGFKEASYSVVNFEKQYMVGFQYTGSPTDKAFQQLMDKAFEAKKKGELQGTFAICYYGNPDPNHAKIGIMVGVLRSDSLAHGPLGSTVRAIEATPAVEARINAYSVVADPEEVNENLRAFAQQKGIMLDSIYIERYAADQELYAYILGKK